MNNLNGPELDNLKHKIAAFKEWAATLATHKAEWEGGYFDKDDFYDEVDRFLEEVPLNEWTSEAYDLLLYALARDNESGTVLRALEKYPEELIALANKALTYKDFHARWQIAYGLSRFKNNKDVAEHVLQQFLKDKDEYVRRRTLLALEYLQEERQ